MALARSNILRLGHAEVGEAELLAALATLAQPRLRPVINASGVLLHTNLGRAPLAEAALERLVQIGRGYSNLEFDLLSGERGSRYAPVEAALCQLCGAEAAVVVNNCAGAVLLVLSALAHGREVIVSRGEAVEIGGGFRIPDVMQQSGARLVEVGTTNKTRLADYERAIGANTALLLKVHRSNFAIVGFTEEATTRELSELGSMKNVPVFEDLGSGCLLDLMGQGLNEPSVQQRMRDGADVVSFSGDKLLGGPQCGVIVGKAELIRRVREHPLNRALRVDKLTVAALEATLELYRFGREDEVPVVRMIREAAESVQRRAEQLVSLLGAQGVSAEAQRSEVQVGGGAQPLVRLPSWAVRLKNAPAEALSAKLRSGEPAVVGRVADDAVWLDLRGVEVEQVEPLAQAVGRAVLSCAVPEGQG